MGILWLNSNFIGTWQGQKGETPNKGPTKRGAKKSKRESVDDQGIRRMGWILKLNVDFKLILFLVVFYLLVDYKILCKKNFTRMRWIIATFQIIFFILIYCVFFCNGQPNHPFPFINQTNVVDNNWIGAEKGH